MKHLTGHCIIHNAKACDFPFLEAVRAAMNVCDDFIILCDPSVRETIEQCEQLEHEFPGRVDTIFEKWWRPEQGPEMLSAATNFCIEACKGDWHLQIQADDVLHESSVRPIRDFIEADGHDWAYIGWRHIFSAADMMLPLDAYCIRLIRLARKSWYPKMRSTGDAMTLGMPDSDPKATRGFDLSDRAYLVHYGYYCLPERFLVHQMEMEDLLAGGTHEKGLVEALETGRIDWGVWQHQPVPFDREHPGVMAKWIEDRDEAIRAGTLCLT